MSAIISVNRIDLKYFEYDTHESWIKASLNSEGLLKAFRWDYNVPNFTDLYNFVKLNGGVWRPDEGGWTFDSPDAAHKILSELIKKHPSVVVCGYPAFPCSPLSSTRISRIPVDKDVAACLAPFPILADFDIPEPIWDAFLLSHKKKKLGTAALFVGEITAIDELIGNLVKVGATCDNSLATVWALGAKDTPVRIEVDGWAVRVKCDLSNARHYLLAPEITPTRRRRRGSPPESPEPWRGIIPVTRRTWPALEARLRANGLRWVGDDPKAELVPAAVFDPALIAGWNSPAPNGLTLHEFQKMGVTFCAERGMRALIGDEMGVGKTAQAIAAAEACRSPRILVVCPANARYVWDREIVGWGGHGRIQHIARGTDALDPAARWHIATYDLLSVRAASWFFQDRGEETAFRNTYPKLAGEITADSEGKRKIILEEFLPETPQFDKPERIAAWQKLMQRLSGGLCGRILGIGPLLIILDEAHRVKNAGAKRTKAIQSIAGGERQILMLTGTPLRNDEHEAAVLLSLLDAQAATVLSTRNGYSIQDLKDYLAHLMIRRTKAEVLPQLPEKTRQRIDIADLDSDRIAAYHDAMADARAAYQEARDIGESDSSARHKMLGALSRARAALGVAKVLGGAVDDLVAEIIENKGSCVVFCAHHEVSDILKSQLTQRRIAAEIVDGRAPAGKRADIVARFQEGDIDVFIGGIDAAGESVTLTRADTVVFIELDWVPAKLLQAEDRIHRVGQQRNCQIIQLVAKLPSGENLDEIMVELLGAKMSMIGSILDESQDNIVATGSVLSALQDRLLGNVSIPMAMHGAIEPNRPVAPTVIETTDQNSFDQEISEDIPAIELTLDSQSPTARKRGRPRIYTDETRPTANQRAKRSVDALAAAGGKRISLRLSAEACQALTTVMAAIGTENQTIAINHAILAQKKALESA